MAPLSSTAVELLWTGSTIRSCLWHKDTFFKIVLSKGTYTIKEFNTKIKVAIQLQRRNEILQITLERQGYKFVIQENHTFVASQVLLTVLL